MEKPKEILKQGCLIFISPCWHDCGNNSIPAIKSIFNLQKIN
jgi:hypothetical protein